MTDGRLMRGVGHCAGVADKMTGATRCARLLAALEGDGGAVRYRGAS